MTHRGIWRVCVEGIDLFFSRGGLSWFRVWARIGFLAFFAHYYPYFLPTLPRLFGSRLRPFFFVFTDALSFLLLFVDLDKKFYAGGLTRGSGSWSWVWR
jgi:hypothetical protein